MESDDMPFDADDIPSNPSTATPLADYIHRRISRRQMLKAALSVGAAAAGIGASPLTARAVDTQAGHVGSTLTFDSLRNVITKTHRVSKGYEATVLIRWGDAVLLDAPPFDPHHLTADAQAKQFGYNNDFVAFLPIAGACH